MAVLSMSKQEFSRLDVLLRVQSGRLRVSDACVLIGLQRRQPTTIQPLILERNRPAGPRRPGRRLAVHDSHTGDEPSQQPAQV